MAIQQRNWQENMWNKENFYNTASAQRQRLEEAGLNPYLMMNGGSAGVSQPAGSGFIESALEPGELINVSYWDTSQQSESRIIEKLYLAQFTKLGTFRLGYRSNFLSIQIGKMKIVLSDGVVTRPLPMNLNAASNGLMRYRFSFAYETYHVEYLDAVPTKIPSAAFENLKF
jgi:hypothetical protein